MSPIYLSTIVNYMYDALLTPGIWSWNSLVPGTGVGQVKVYKTFNPFIAMESRVFDGIFLIPQVDSISMNRSQRRGKVITIGSDLVIDVLITHKFKTQDEAAIDSASWAEIELWQNFRQDVDHLLTKVDYSSINAQVEEVEPLPADEMKMDQRSFGSQTTFSFGAIR